MNMHKAKRKVILKRSDHSGIKYSNLLHMLQREEEYNFDWVYRIDGKLIDKHSYSTDIAERNNLELN